jgi:hypothetical protein
VTRAGRPRLVRRAVVGVAAITVSALLLSACGQSAGALGHEACIDVAKSLSLYADSFKTHNPAASSRDQAKALDLLRTALRPAALAGSSDGDWQALMTTLSESNRVPEGKLVTALSAQCAETLSNS